MSVRSRARIPQDGGYRLQRGAWSQYDIVCGPVLFDVVAVSGEGKTEQAGVADASSHLNVFKRVAQKQQVVASGELRDIGLFQGVFVQAVDKRRLVRHRIAFRVENQRVGDDDDIGGGDTIRGESGFDDFLDARGQNDQGNAAIVEGIEKKARTISKVRPIFADNPLDRLRA